MKQPKQFSLWDLQENKVYAAINKAGRRLDRLFFRKNGQLYNQHGEWDEEGGEEVASGCVYVPRAAEWVFEEVKTSPAKIEKKSDTPKDSVLNVKEGFVYQWIGGPLSGETYVLREKKQLHFSSKAGLKGAKVKADRISLYDRFIQIGPVEQPAPIPVASKPAKAKPVSLFQQIENRHEELVSR